MGCHKTARIVHVKTVLGIAMATGGKSAIYMYVYIRIGIKWLGDS